MITTGDKEFFKGIDKIQFEGKESDNPFAFKYYDETKMIGGKTMKVSGKRIKGRKYGGPTPDYSK